MNYHGVDTNFGVVHGSSAPFPEVQGGGDNVPLPRVSLHETDADNWILMPEPSDVLLGRGKSNQKHPGNVHFRALIKSYREAYFSANNNLVKKTITDEIVRAIGGRFLKKASSKHRGWYVVTGHPRRVKVAQALQYRQRRSIDAFTYVPSSASTGLARNCMAARATATSTPTSRPSFPAAVNRTQLPNKVNRCISFGSHTSLNNSASGQPKNFSKTAIPHATPSTLMQMLKVPNSSFSPLRQVKSRRSTSPPEKVGSSRPHDALMPEPIGSISDNQCGDEDSKLVSDDELLWALGYSSETCPGGACDHDLDVSSSCHIGYTAEEYHRTPRVPVSPDHRNDNVAWHGKSLSSFNDENSLIDTSTGDDIFSTLERAGFLVDATWG